MGLVRIFPAAMGKGVEMEREEKKRGEERRNEMNVWRGVCGI